MLSRTSLVSAARSSSVRFKFFSGTILIWRSGAMRLRLRERGAPVVGFFGYPLGAESSAKDIGWAFAAPDRRDRVCGLGTGDKLADIPVANQIGAGEVQSHSRDGGFFLCQPVRRFRSAC